MVKRILNFFNSNSFYAIKLHIIICLISTLSILFLNYISSTLIIIMVHCLYFISGRLLNKRNASVKSLYSILVFIYLLKIIQVLAWILPDSSNGLLPISASFAYYIFSDPVRIISNNLFLTLILPFFPIMLMYCGMKISDNIQLDRRFDKLEKLKNKLIVFKMAFYIFITGILFANIYLIYNPKINIYYSESIGLEGFKETIAIDENGNYHYMSEWHRREENKDIKLKLTKNEYREIILSVIYKNSFFRLDTDLSVYNKTDQSVEDLKIYWLGNTKEVSGYGIEKMSYWSIASSIKVKIYQYEKDNYKFGYINKNDSISLYPKYDHAYSFSGGYAQVMENDKEYYTDKFGNALPGKPKGFSSNPPTTLKVKEQNFNYGFVDCEGNFVISPKYFQANDFSEGLACVKIDDKWGYIDKTGRFVIEPKYDYAYPFSEGLGCVKIKEKGNGMWGYIDNTGKYIIEHKYIRAEPFVDGLACVRMDLSAGEIGKDNRYNIK